MIAVTVTALPASATGLAAEVSRTAEPGSKLQRTRPAPESRSAGPGPRGPKAGPSVRPRS